MIVDRLIDDDDDEMIMVTSEGVFLSLSQRSGAVLTFNLKTKRAQTSASVRERSCCFIDVNLDHPIEVKDTKVMWSIINQAEEKRTEEHSECVCVTTTIAF